MSKKIIIINLLIIIILSIVACSKLAQQDTTNNSNSIDTKNINPISKDTVINILKAEYGDNILIKDEDIKLVGDLYFVDVYVELEDYEEDETHETHTHNQSLGTHKIDKYTGEIIKE